MDDGHVLFKLLEAKICCYYSHLPRAMKERSGGMAPLLAYAAAASFAKGLHENRI